VRRLTHRSVSESRSKTSRSGVGLRPSRRPGSILGPPEALKGSSSPAPASASRWRADLAPTERRRRAGNTKEGLLIRAPASGHSNFAGLYGRPIAAGGMIKSNINTDWGLHDWRAGVFVPDHCRTCYTGCHVVRFRQYSRPKYGNRCRNDWPLILIRIRCISEIAVFRLTNPLIFSDSDLTQI